MSTTKNNRPNNTTRQAKPMKTFRSQTLGKVTIPEPDETENPNWISIEIARKLEAQRDECHKVIDDQIMQIRKLEATIQTLIAQRDNLNP